MINNPPANAGDAGDGGSIPGWGRSPGGGNGNPLPCSCGEYPKDRGAWGAAVCEAAEGRTQLSTAQHQTEVMKCQLLGGNRLCSPCC